MNLAGSLLLITLHLSPDGGSLLTSEPALAPLWSALRAEESADRFWYWGWASFLGAVVVGQTVIAATTSNEGSRINAYVNIPASAVGMLAVLLVPPAAAFGLEEIQVMPESTPAEREAKAAALRNLFHRAVEQQRFYRSPLNHVVGLTVNAGLAALLYFGFKLGAGAARAGGRHHRWELQIFTRPTAALDAATSRPGSGLQGFTSSRSPTASRSPARSERESGPSRQSVAKGVTSRGTLPRSER
jgi:hypothetical protein